MDQILLGARLREAREALGVSLRSVAGEIGVSPSLLSQIENGKTNPSVDTLYALVQQLGISVDAVLGINGGASGGDGVDDDASQLSADPTHHTVIQAAADTPAIEMENGVLWERLAVLPGQDVEALRVTYQPGASSSVEGRLMQHLGRENLIIVSGELGVRFDDGEITLREGDSMAFDSRRLHLFVNTSEQPALGIWFVEGREAQLRHARLHSEQLEADLDSPPRTTPVSAIDVMRSFREH